jgi:hypothetical protein
MGISVGRSATADDSIKNASNACFSLRITPPPASFVTMFWGVPRVGRAKLPDMRKLGSGECLDGA